MRKKYLFNVQFLFVPVVLMLLLLLINSWYGSLLFHTLVELFSVCIGILLFVVAWNTRDFLRNDFLLFLGCGYFYVALFDLLHTLTFNGMSIFPNATVNTTLHLWIYSRFFEATLLLLSSYFIKRSFNHNVGFALGGAIFIAVSYVALNIDAPELFIKGQGLTDTKIISEYVIIAILLTAAFRFYRVKDDLPDTVWRLIVISIILTALSEFLFNTYVEFWGFSLLFGHMLKFFSFWLIYRAVIEDTLKKPFSMLSLSACSYDALPNPTVLCDAEGQILQANKVAKDAYRLAHSQLKQVHDLTHPSHISKAECELCQQITSGDITPAKAHYFSKLDKWFLIGLSPITKTKNQMAYIQTSTDVTEQVNAKQDLTMAKFVLDNMSEGVLVTDADKNIIKVNKAFEEVTGYSEQEVLGKNPRVLSSGRQSPSFYKKMWGIIEKEGVWKGELWNRHKNGSVFPEFTAINKVDAMDDTPKHYIAVFSETTHMKNIENQLEYLSHYDSLTNLPNKTLFKGVLDTSIRHHQRNEDKLGVLFLGVDNFSLINETGGRAIGDAVLITIAERFSEQLRDSDIICRCTGDEFVVLIEDVKTPSDLAIVANKLIDGLKKPVYYKDEIPIYVTVSIGISMSPDEPIKADTLVQQANAAMFSVKKQSKNNYHFYSSMMDQDAERRLLLESQLRMALDRNEIYIVYQPKVSSVSQQVLGAEALMRWNNAIMGEVYPDEFIPIAESMGIIIELTDYILDQSLQQVKKWRDITQKKLAVAVNFSSKHFSKKSLLIDIKSSLKNHDLMSDALQIEITERLLLKKNDSVLTLLNEIAQSGIELSIDDFGTGYSSLSYLKKFPIHTVKIDKTFIDDLATENEDKVLVKTIILMAQGLGMSVVAEGVEEQEQLDIYKKLGGDVVQGYYYSKPLKEDDFIRFIQQDLIP